MRLRTLAALFLAVHLGSPGLTLGQEASKPAKAPVYKKREIVAARFGDKERQEWINKAYAVKKVLDTKIFGEERATYALQEALIQFGESYGSRTREPVALHYIGLPGIGKSALLTELAKQGFNVVTFDMQGYDSRGSSNRFGNGDLGQALYTNVQNNKDKPTIFVFDEIDKIPEIAKDGTEVTQPAIGTLNEILTDGVTSYYGTELKLNNVLVITTMNFSPTEIEYFSREVLKQNKSYYDFTLDDFRNFDDWLTNNPGARYQVLSHLFRANTVSRLAPNTSIFKPLNHDDFVKISVSNIHDSIKRITSQQNGKGRMDIKFSDAFAVYLNDITMVPSSGARETVFRSDRLTDQLIGFATKYQDPNLSETRDLPRKVFFDVKTLPTNPATVKISVTVTPQKIHGKDMIDLTSFTFDVDYRNDVRLFQRPDSIQPIAPPVTSAKVAEKPITQKQILASRFPKDARLARGVAQKLDNVVIGQQLTSNRVEAEMNKYLGRTGPALKEPSFLFIAGFPGIGKSLEVNTVAGIINVPVIRIGMQQYTGQDAVQSFIRDLDQKIASVKSKAPNGKYILLIEELDKVYEVNPQNGAIVDRPVMGMVKDLLVDGTLTVQVPNGNNNFQMKTLDVRDAFTFVTMNFGADLFGFKADPRLTTADDMIAAWARLSSHPADLKNILGKLFLPETISRIISNFEIMKPLTEEDYAKLIKGVVESASLQRLTQKGKNVAQIDLKLTPRYQQYLLDETVIPSEGARYTALSSQGRITYDMEYALYNIAKTSDYAAKPFTLILDFNPRTDVISYRVRMKNDSSIETIAKRKVILTFPRPEANGLLDPVRSLTSVHEFGHTYAAIRLGLRFELATVIPPETGTGGYLKTSDNGLSARARLADLYSSLGSRATERIFYSADPLAEAAVLDISSGPSSDISAATKEIYSMIYTLGFDPQGGTINRSSDVTAQPFSKFEDIPTEQLEAIGRIMRKMESQMIVDFLKAHDIHWFREKISAFGHAGTLREGEFYKMIGYPYPGEGTGFLSEGKTILGTLDGVIDPSSKIPAIALGFKQGATQTTASENLDAYAKVFQDLLATELHGLKPTNCETIFTVQDQKK